MTTTKTRFRAIIEHNNLKAASSSALANAIAACFDLPDIAFTVEEKAVAIVEALYDLDLLVDKDEQKTIITELLYTLYYEQMVAREDVPFFILQIAAAKGCDKTVQSALEGMSPEEKVRLLAFLFKHYREGSWPLLGTLANQGNPHLKQLIDGLLQHYYDLEHVLNVVPQSGWDPETLVNDLENLAEQESKECFAMLSNLIPQVYHAMLKVYEQVGENDAKILLHKAEFASTFGSYFSQPFLFEEFLEFSRLFGLRAYPPLFVENTKEPGALKEKLALCSAEQVQKNAALIHSFLSSILCHILAMREQKMPGLNLLICSIATSGKNLSTLASLPTILEGYLRAGAILLEHPIFVFDQSSPELLSQNRRYIDRLNKTHNSKVISVSKEEALELARRLHIEDLINTTKTGTFGYGGARNCQYLLTGVLKAAYSDGITSIEELLALEDTALLSLFHANVLTSKWSLLLIDDDMQLSAGAIFSSALLAKQTSSSYTSASGFQIGRETKTVYGIYDLSTLLQGTKSPFPKWSDVCTPSGIAEYTCKPKICLNLPHGCEESHLWVSCKTHFYLKPACHLSGSRYPSAKIPTCSFVGLEEHLKNSMTNELLIGMISTLVDPQNSFGMCMLPWNDAAYHDTIRYLQDALEVIALESTQKELRRRFLQNIRQFFGNTRENAYYNALQHLMQLDVNRTIKAFKKQNPGFTTFEQFSLNAIGELYKQTQEDVRLFWHFGQLFAEVDSEQKLPAAIKRAYNETLPSYPIAYGFYLLSCSLAKGEFCEAVRLMLAKDTLISKKINK